MFNQDVESPHAANRLVNQLFALAHIAHVGGENEHAAAERFDLTGRVLQWRGPATGQHDVGTVFGEDESAAPSDARAGTGDDGYPSVQREPTHTTVISISGSFHH